ncbi:hypothetical protein CFC21_049495, partial [Triticum aestivum]
EEVQEEQEAAAVAPCPRTVPGGHLWRPLPAAHQPCLVFLSTCTRPVR